MKNKKFLRYFVSILLAVYMLAAACLPAAAFVVEGATDPVSNLPSFSLEYENGMLSLRVNAELLYEVISDKRITKEEVEKFLPEDILALFENGQKPSVDELRAVLSNYLTVDELREMVNDLPIDLAKSLVDIEMITNIITVDELMSLVNIDELLKDVSDEALLELVKGEPLKLMLTSKVLDTVAANLDPDAMKNMLAASDVKSAVKEQVQKILNGEANDALLNEILENSEIFEALFTESVRSTLIEMAIGNLTDQKLQQMETDGLIVFANLNESSMKSLMDAGVIEIAAESVNVSEVVKKIGKAKLLEYLKPNGSAQSLSENDLAADFYKKGYFTYQQIKETGALTFNDEVVAKLRALLKEKGLSDDEIKTLFGTSMSDDQLVESLFDLLENGTITIEELEACGAINTDTNNLKSLVSSLNESDVYKYFYGNESNKESVLKNLLFADEPLLDFEELVSVGALKSENFDAAAEAVKALLEAKITEKINNNELTPDEIQELRELTDLSGEALLRALFEKKELFVGGGKIVLTLAELESLTFGSANETVLTMSPAVLKNIMGLLEPEEINASFFGNEKETLLKQMLFVDRVLSLDALKVCGIIHTDASAIEGVKNLLQAKADEGLLDLNAYLTSSLTDDKLQSLLNDSRLSLADFLAEDLGLVDTAKINLDVVLGWIGEANLLNYVRGVKNNPQYTWINVAYDFYVNGYIEKSLTAVKELGAKVNPSKLTWTLAQNTGILTKDTIVYH